MPHTFGDNTRTGLFFLVSLSKTDYLRGRKQDLSITLTYHLGFKDKIVPPDTSKSFRKVEYIINSNSFFILLLDRYDSSKHTQHVVLSHVCTC